MSDKTIPPLPKERLNFDIVVVTPDSVIFEDVATRLIAPSVKEDLGILPNHAPLYAELKKGELDITLTDGTSKKIPIEAGIIRIKNNHVSIVTGFSTMEMMT